MNMITEATEKAALAAFWRKGRKAYVPLTQDELRRAMGEHACNPAILFHAGLIKSERVGVRDRLYHITEAGKQRHMRHMVETAK